MSIELAIKQFMEEEGPSFHLVSTNRKELIYVTREHGRPIYDIASGYTYDEAEDQSRMTVVGGEQGQEDIDEANRVGRLLMDRFPGVTFEVDSSAPGDEYTWLAIGLPPMAHENKVNISKATLISMVGEEEAERLMEQLGNFSDPDEAGVEISLELCKAYCRMMAEAFDKAARNSSKPDDVLMQFEVISRHMDSLQSEMKSAQKAARKMTKKR